MTHEHCNLLNERGIVRPSCYHVNWGVPGLRCAAGAWNLILSREKPLMSLWWGCIFKVCVHVCMCVGIYLSTVAHVHVHCVSFVCECIHHTYTTVLYMSTCMKIKVYIENVPLKPSRLELPGRHL